MRVFCLTPAAFLFGCATIAFAETTTCDQALTAPLHVRSVLTIDSRPAGLEIVGTDEDTIHVSCQLHNGDSDNTRRIRLRFSPNAVGGKLMIEGEHLRHGNGAQIRIEIPKKTSLTVRMFAGEVKVEQISGDKDIQIGAGQITISNHNWNYRNVEASVSIGQVNAPMYNANKGGFFRSVSETSTGGEFRLRAHVTTGQVDLQGKRLTPGRMPQPD
ncbi:MAG TPA: hypothetical protein VN753_16355 [Terracidiphilus sp.]|nr:hypothetical protein [Terracidiphilus sp.]